MPIKFMSWNVQDFGAGGPLNELLHGTHSVRRADFIAWMVAREHVDVLGLMELWPGGRGWLPPYAAWGTHTDLVNVVLALNNRTGCADWVCDYIPGSIAAGTALGELHINFPDELTWESDGGSPRREGYAFFWRDRVPPAAPFVVQRTRYGLSHGVFGAPGYVVQNGGHVVGLSMTQRPTVDSHRPPFVSDRDGYLLTAPPAAWEPSYYPGSSKYNAYQSFWQQVRRPAYICIIPTAGPADPIALSCYHAPSYSTSANIGTRTSAYARELYASYSFVARAPQPAMPFVRGRAAAGGDFNVPFEGTSARYYQPFLQAPSAAAPAGPGCDAVYNGTTRPAIPTTVQLRQREGGLFNGDPITSAHVSDYLFSSIDNIFFQGMAPHNRIVWDVPTDLMADNLLSGEPIRAYYQLIYDAYAGAAVGPGGVDPNYGPRKPDGSPVFPFLIDWGDFWPGVHAGGFRTARAACEFYRGFISDHLPVVLTFDPV